MEKHKKVVIKEITKSFAGVKALDCVDLNLIGGKVHGLIGANGAGKSTLIKILAGIYQPDAGAILIDEKRVEIPNPSASAELGFSFIHQELNLVPKFNVIENLTMGLKKEKKAGLVDWKNTANRLQSTLDLIGFSKSPYTPIEDLTVGEQWMVAIAKAVFQDASFIAMDEPTAALSQTEVERLFSIIKGLLKQGIGIIYVSHRLDEVMELCDEVTVFKDGKKVLYAEVKNITKEEIVTAIAGRKISSIDTGDYHFQNVPEILSVERLKDAKKVKGVTFNVKKGEILGLTGLVGSGRTEVAKMIFGVNHMVEGKMMFEGKTYIPKTPSDAVKKGIVIVPEDRRKEGLILSQSVSFNISLPNLKILHFNKVIPFLSSAKKSKVAEEAVNNLQIKTSSVNTPVMNLSGGNQQKVVIGKWLKRNPKLIIMDEPTQGVDVGARTEIYRLIKEMAFKGISFLVISSDIEELPGLCDRVVVMHEGKCSGELTGNHITKQAILRLCYTRHDENRKAEVI